MLGRQAFPAPVLPVMPCVARDARQSGLLTLDSLSPPPACPPGDTSLSFFILAVMHMSAMGKYFPWYESPYFTILPLITSDPARRSDLLTLDSLSPQAMPSGNTVSFLPAWDLRDFNWLGR